ncbi:hypothetical protein HU200_025613 [Digitaria exilis]|uniref:OCEL domain-containing protein n=1 Tax=Digitaria exilis TaxID=1010633 RepID=A0A835EXS3_9POAL|nr:hypothetical protein HU200_025613 [Digitaria exilis]CAB3496850.1 unnamed protein product [Digitaria exilis]
MYKLGGRGGGRGGGGGASKRPPAPHGRGRGGSSSIGGMGAPPRGRAAAAAQPAGRDESFRLESSGPPAFAAIIRLTPDLVDEIRRAEEAGGGARIKFNPNMYNSSENVIDVNGKEFKFTWASERGELCDIYEERQSGEDGNGLLLECGSAWRKVNVQRILDESAKNLVKMRSEEAERLSKSRKSIVLDPANPSVKSQAKSMAAAAVEGSMRRMPWKKNEFFKKNKAAAIAPTKSISKVKLSNNIPKGNFSTSPAPSPEQPGANIPSFPVGSDANNEVITPFDLNKEENSKTEKATPNKMSKGINRRASAHSASVDDNTNEVRSLLISVLSENPKGMSLKALEKAVADVLPNASKKIESSIKNIANYQAPGRYVLKPEFEVENSKRHVEGGRSINENTEEFAPSLKIDDPDIFESIDVVGSPATTAGDGKVNNGSEDKAGTSSESGSDSDSDSDSSDSGSDSGSQSRSAADSGSGSSSDSDSDASSSSKDGSDAFVDITSDDDRANTAQTKVSDDLNLSTSPRDLTRLDVDDEQIDIGTNMDYRTASPHIDLNNFNTDNDDAEAEGFAAGNLKKPSEIPGSKNTPSTRMDPTHVDSKYNEMSYQADLFDDSLKTISENLPNEEAGQLTKQHSNRRKSTSKDGSNHGPMSIADKSAKPKLKRSSGNENSTTKPESAKKIKVDVASPGITGPLSEHRKGLPPEKHSNDRLNKEAGSVSRNVSRDSSPAMKGRPLASGNIQKIDHSPNVPIPTMHSERPKENIEKSSLKKKTEKMQKPWHGIDGDFGIGYSHGEGHHANFDGSDDSSARKKSRYGDPLDDKMLKRSKDANPNINSMNLTKSSSGNAGPDEIAAFPGLNESNGELSTSQRVNVERSPHGKKRLQRELSDLELGEFRETSLENDNERTRKQFERNNSSKSLDAKLASIDNSYPGMNNRKAHVSGFHDRGKPSPQEYGVGGQINQEAFPRKAAGYDFDDNGPQQRGNIPENQHFPRTDASDSDNISYRPGEKTSKRDSRMAQGGVLEHAEKKKKATSRLPQNGYNNATVTRTQKSISPSDNEERSRNNSLIESETGRKRDSSSDDDNLFFSKYDKDEPELKAPIKDFSQYKDYVQEYNEKYGVYTYLNSQIEKTKSEFLKVQEDLNVAKERDKEQYYNIVGRLRDMYRESGARHKLMKKVFVLLHEELQTMKQRITDFTEAYSNE